MKLTENYRLSKNFELKEFEYSAKAQALNIDNRVLSTDTIENIKTLVNEVLQPLRDKLKAPVIISSGYRCPKLNDAIEGSSKTSQHVKGQACDIKVKGLTSFDLASSIIDLNLDYDQLILYPSFVHVSYNKKGNRKALLYNKSYKGKSSPYSSKGKITM